MCRCERVGILRLPCSAVRRADKFGAFPRQWSPCSAPSESSPKHLTPSHPISPHAIPSHPISPYPIPYHPIPPHLTSSQPISVHPVPSQATPSRLTHPIPSHPIPCHLTPPHTISFHPMLSHPIPCHLTPLDPTTPYTPRATLRSGCGLVRITFKENRVGGIKFVRCRLVHTTPCARRMDRLARLACHVGHMLLLLACCSRMPLLAAGCSHMLRPHAAVVCRCWRAAVACCGHMLQSHADACGVLQIAGCIGGADITKGGNITTPLRSPRCGAVGMC